MKYINLNRIVRNNAVEEWIKVDNISGFRIDNKHCLRVYGSDSLFGGNEIFCQKFDNSETANKALQDILDWMEK